MLPQAIREDHDPPRRLMDPVTFIMRGLNPLVLLRWTTFRCPHCQAAFRRDYLPHKVRLGRGMHICKQCGKIFDDGAREWPQLQWSDKARCLLPVPLVGALIGTLLCSFIALHLAPRDEVNVEVVVAVLGLALVPAFLWWIIRVPQVFRSIHRYENEPRLIGTDR